MTELKRPLVAALAAFSLALAVALRHATPLHLPLIGVLLTLVAIQFSSSGQRSGNAERILILSLFGSAGLLLGIVTRADLERDCRSRFADGTLLEIEGWLGAAHRPEAAGARTPLLPLLNSAVRGLDQCGGEFRIRLPDDVPALPPGAAIIVRGEWRAYTSPINPTHWPRDATFRGFVRVDSVAVTTAQPPAGSPLMFLRFRADAALSRLFPDHHPMVEALLLGRREYVDPLVTERFAASGLTHLLAISGSHVALFAAALLLVCSALRISRSTAIYATLAITWVYLLIIGAPASALRAGCMITIALGAVLLQRVSAAGPVMALAAFVIIALRPLSILDPGFQLSFLGVMGIVWLKKPVMALMPDALQRKGPLRSVTDSLVISIAAFAATAPVVAHHFGMLAPVSIIAGVPAIPLTSLALVGTAAALAFEPISFAFAALIADGAAAALDLVTLIADLSARVPWGHTPVPPPPWWSWLVAALVCYALSRLISFRSPSIRRTFLSGSALTVIVLWPLGQRALPGDLEIYFLDVGQGDAIAIRTPRHRWVLVDTGPASGDFDAGERRVLPFLREHGVRGIEFMVLTHPHLDHIGGAVALLDALRVDLLIEPGHAEGSQTYLAVLEAVDGSETEWRAARSGRSLTLDGVRFDFLWPDSQNVDAVEDPNQISAVVRVSYGEFSLLLTGDAGVEVETILLARHGSALESDVLKLGHHGSTTSSSAPFLDAVNPSLAVVSAGRRNGYGHPALPILAAVAARDIDLARTDQDGTVTLKVARGGDQWARMEW